MPQPEAIASLVNQLQLTPDELRTLQTLWVERHSIEGEILLRPEVPNAFLYFLLKGELSVVASTKKAQQTAGELEPPSSELNRILAPSLVGETSSILGEAPVASVITRGNVLLMALDMNQVRALNDRSLENKLLHFATRTLTQKIQSSNSRMVSALEARVKALEERRRQSIFMTQIFIGLSLYLFGLNAVQPLNAVLPANTLISGAVIIGFLFATLYSIKKSQAPLKLYGLHLDTWKKDIVQSLIWSSPLLVLAVAFKFFWSKWDTTGRVRFLQPEAIFTDPAQFSWGMWGVASLAYITLSIAQEVIGRSGIQSTLRVLFTDDHMDPEGTKRADRKAIWVSSLLFSATHTHLGATFSALVFLPGLFWAWMFSKQGSIVGTCLSHIILGLVLVFILGLPI